jgi:tRNA(Ile)-lysidine synthase
MHLLAAWAHAGKKPAPVVLTVDHGLRKASSADAKAVVTAAKALGLTAHVLKWQGKKPNGNIEAAAREARYALMGAWCRANGVGALYVGHTRDDQAETFLLRLGRGSGLDGLAAMSAIARWPLPGFDDLRVVRPLLGLDRSELQAWLTANGVRWRDDPMNAKDRFARTRIRHAWPILEQIGLTKARIADAASHLARVRLALEAETDAFLAQAVRAVPNGVVLDAKALSGVPREIGLRALATLLSRVGGAAYRPRFERLESLFDAVVVAEFRKARTLHGCRIGPAPKALATFGSRSIVIVREAGRVKPKTGQAVHDIPAAGLTV